MKEKLFITELTIIVLITGFLVRLFNVLRFPVLPVAFDPWFHFSVTNIVLNGGYIPLNFYRGGLLLHLFTASLSLITGVDVFILVKYLPIILGSINLTCFYFLIKKVTENGKIIIFSMLFLAVIDFSFIYATNQYWPELISLPLMALSIGFLIETYKKNNIKSALLGSLIFLIIVMTHDFSSLITMVTLMLTLIFIFTYDGKINLPSIIFITTCSIIWLGWGLLFNSLFVLMSVVSEIIIYVPCVFLLYVVWFLFLRKIKNKGSFDQFHFKKYGYYAWLIFTVVGVVTIVFLFNIPPLSNSVNLTPEFMFLALPMELIFLSLISLGSLILFMNFHFESNLTMGIIGGAASLLPIPIILYQFSITLIEVERLLEFAFIGGSIIVAISISFLLTKISNNAKHKKIKSIILISTISFMVIPGVLYSFPTPSMGLTYLNWNTQSELKLTEWALNHINGEIIVSDWRVGYILRGYLANIPNGYDIVINADLLYWNSSYRFSELGYSQRIYLVLDDWMVLNGPTQPFSYGRTYSIYESKLKYESNSSYVKIYDNSYEWVYCFLNI
ncbi:MAG: hypothetical protein ACTSYQ_04770 [Candidatus Odinarchaeia archaeon]